VGNLAYVKNTIKKMADNFFDFMFNLIYGKKVRTEQLTFY
jgi:hypothetical protein